jgi:cardiolipin synthase
MRKPTSSGNRVLCLKGGSSFFNRLLVAIQEAKVFIHIQLYILGNDATGKLILEELFAAGKRGVDVYLMLDAFGSNWVGNEELAEWSKRGLQVKLFARRFRFKRVSLGRRHHAKVIVIDNTYLSVGGMNFADRYSGFNGQEPWLDFTTWIEGPAAEQLNKIISAYWARKLRRKLKQYPAYTGATENGITVALLFNDWLRGRNAIKSSYFSALGKAKKEIIIVAGYFVPSHSLIRLLKIKAAEGVKVRLFFSSISDVPLVKKASEYYYDELRNAGVEIREWNHSLLHAKVALIDKCWLTIGSYNLNQLSDYGGLEVNVSFNDHALGTDFSQEFIEPLESQTAVISSESTRFITRFNRYLSFLAIRIALKVLLLRT